jgi:Holliday junction resolvase RusA-like endonuclease
MFIPHQFTTLNQYIKAERTNRYISAKIKREETLLAESYFIGEKYKTPLRIKFIWHIKDKRTDPDNIAFCKKFILDGMVNSKAIENDSIKYIKGFEDEFIIDKDNIGVEVIMEEVDDE